MAVSLSISAYESSYSIANNSSQVVVSVIANYSSGSYNRNKQYGFVICDGQTSEFSANFNYYISSSGSETLATATFTVYHNSDGTKTISCGGYYETGVSSGNIEAYTSLKLTDIPRDAQLLTAENFSDEDNPTITYENQAGSSMGTFQACIADSAGATIYVPYRDISKTGTSYTFNLTDAERNTLRNAIPNAKSMTVKFYIKYVLGGETKYSSIAKTFSIVNGNPVISPTIQDIDAET